MGYAIMAITCAVFFIVCNAYGMPLWVDVILAVLARAYSAAFEETCMRPDEGGDDDRDRSADYDVYVYFGSRRGLCLARHASTPDPRYYLVWRSRGGIVRKNRPWHRMRG